MPDKLPDYVYSIDQLRQVVQQLTGVEYDDATVFALYGFLRDLSENDSGQSLKHQ